MGNDQNLFLKSYIYPKRLSLPAFSEKRSPVNPIALGIMVIILFLLFSPTLWADSPGVVRENNAAAELLEKVLKEKTKGPVEKSNIIWEPIVDIYKRLKGFF